MQGTVQQRFVVRAVQLECKCQQHECSQQASAIQLLESAADRRRMEERRLEHDFWDVAREALGMHTYSLTTRGTCYREEHRRCTHRSACRRGLDVACAGALGVLVHTSQHL